MAEPEDFFGAGLERYGRGLRDGTFTIEAATRACYLRIVKTNGKLQSFVHVAENAIQTACALDQLLAAGTDLGPLMGVPVGVKDLFGVAGMPTRLGSRVDFEDIVPQEGSFVRRLRSAGCVILGKTRTTEFAMGGVNLTHPTAWNPRSPDEHRTPGGSSAGSAVAVASGQCPIAFGSDTGGSVRQPAALCGVVGFKASATCWDADGIFSFSPSFDSIGFLSANVADAAFFYRGLQDTTLPTAQLEDLRLGRPPLEDLAVVDADVAAAYEDALVRLERAGAHIVPLSLPDTTDIDDIARVAAIELIGRLGRARLAQARELIDPVAMARLESTMDAAEYVELMQRLRRFRAAADTAIHEAGVRAWLSPTVAHTATSMAELKTVAEVAAWNARTFRITRLANLLDQAAISLPLQTESPVLPAGLQMGSGAGSETELLATAVAVEQALSSQ